MSHFNSILVTLNLGWTFRHGLETSCCERNVFLFYTVEKFFIVMNSSDNYISFLLYIFYLINVYCHPQKFLNVSI